MKLSAIATLAAVIAVPVATTLLTPDMAEARGRGNRSELVAQRGDRGNLTTEEREAKRAERAAKMQEALGLSDTQMSEIQAIRERYQPQKQALREEAKALKEGGASREEIKEALGDRKQALREQVKSEIQAILTPEQAQKLEELKEERRGRRGQRRSRRQGNAAVS